MTFNTMFHDLTGLPPYSYQCRLACGEQSERDGRGESSRGTPCASQAINVPTGMGKTAAVVLAWFWNRVVLRRPDWPRRLIYSLPTRALVDQTADNVKQWLTNAGMLADCFGDDAPCAGWAEKNVKRSHRIPVAILMGGEDQEDWELYPEREAILIGTQDMLLSRALNRGYASSRARWPIQCGLLNRDCLWVFDEVQLMGAGLATTSQLEAFRDGKNSCHSYWMSATLQKDWLRTVDFGDLSNLPVFSQGSDDEAHSDCARRVLNANKPVQAARSGSSDVKKLADEILRAHAPGGRTLVVLNTVERAKDLFKELSKRKGAKPAFKLLHSRFRPADRARHMKQALAKPPEPGVIVISTQVVEAGVDFSAAVLFTELAPWSSLVQRFGRCNRRGQEDESAHIYWIDLPEKDAAPYDSAAMNEARERIKTLANARPSTLPKVSMPYRTEHVLRRKDWLDLFDTTPDLAGNDIDIDRYVRGTDESDVKVFWRTWEGNDPPPSSRSFPAPAHDELCSVPAFGKNGFKVFVEDKSKRVFRWDWLEGEWVRASKDRVFPGQVFLVHGECGGYSVEMGWDVKEIAIVGAVPAAEKEPSDSSDADELSQLPKWQTIAEHTDAVCHELKTILDTLAPPYRAALEVAARWHDLGKAHPVFQNAIGEKPQNGGQILAKAPKKNWQRYERKHFRHELASALAILIDSQKQIPDGMRDLVAYLVAAHHGKVRLSIRSLPEEKRPRDSAQRFARGIWDGDTLAEVDLGGGVRSQTVTLSLELMELGRCEGQPFEGQASWSERMLTLRDTVGPFQLAWLEALLRAADLRASRK